MNGFRSYCPDCDRERWHDSRGDDEAECRVCGLATTRGERHEARTEARLDDLEPDLKGASEPDGQTDLTDWKNEC